MRPLKDDWHGKLGANYDTLTDILRATGKYTNESTWIPWLPSNLMWLGGGYALRYRFEYRRFAVV